MVIKQISTFTSVYGDTWEAILHGEGTCTIEFNLEFLKGGILNVIQGHSTKLKTMKLNKKKRVEEDNFGEYLMINEICTFLF